MGSGTDGMGGGAESCSLHPAMEIHVTVTEASACFRGVMNRLPVSWGLTFSSAALNAQQSTWHLRVCLEPRECADGSMFSGREWRAEGTICPLVS